MAVTRRDFIRGGVAAFTVSFTAPAFLSDIARAQGARSRSLVVIYLSGGNDALNTVVPYQDPFYYSRRPTIAVPAGTVLQIGTDSSGRALGLHPRLTGLQGIFNEGRLAIVQRTGYQNSSRSHFQGSDIWGTANPSNSTTTGWLGRYLETVPKDGLSGWATTREVPRAMVSKDVSVPGIPDGDGFAGLIAGAAGLSGAPLRRLLEDALAVPVAIDNDVNLAALAESRERGIDDLAFIGIGTGVGMGIVTGGRLLRGAHGAAGELGQLPVGDHAVAPPDELGPLEAIAGGAGLAARARAGSAHEVFEAGPRALLDDQARVLAAAIRAVVALLDPELTVLGGGIGCRPDVLARVQAALAAHGTPAPPVETSRLGEDAGLLGALALAREPG